MSHIKDSEDRQKISKIISKAQKSLKNYMICGTDFCTPNEITMALPIIKQINDLSYKIYGAYEGAERQVIIFYPDIFTLEKEDYPINTIVVKGDFHKNNLSHRDFLGAILSLGLKREKIGDIIIEENKAYVVGHKEINEYIMLNLRSVKKVLVTTDIMCSDVCISKNQSFKLIQTTVASLRLDTIVAKGFFISRNIATKMIKSEKVKLNYKIQTNVNSVVKCNDIISVRGKGRMEISQVGGKTKKDRYKIEIKRMV